MFVFYIFITTASQMLEHLIICRYSRRFVRFLPNKSVKDTSWSLSYHLKDMHTSTVDDFAERDVARREKNNESFKQERRLPNSGAKTSLQEHRAQRQTVNTPISP